MTKSKFINIMDIPINSMYEIFRKIDKCGADDCWNWKGHIVRGYGVFPINERKHLAHRLVYSLLVGPIPINKILCHKCNNRRCCNPEHLYIGTYQTNSRDTVISGNSHTVKLSAERVILIRKYWQSGQYSQIKLGKMFGVSNTTINRIVNHKIWAYVQESLIEDEQDVNI